MLSNVYNRSPIKIIAWDRYKTQLRSAEVIPVDWYNLYHEKMK